MNGENVIKDKEGGNLPNNAYFVCQKAEKLTCALYKVTDFISDKEPLKWQMRDLASESLSSLSPIGQMSRIESGPVLKKTSNLIASIASLCEVAKSTGIFSEMNFSILKTEYLALKQHIDRQDKGEVHRAILAIPPSSGKETGVLGPKFKGQSKGQKIEGQTISPITVQNLRSLEIAKAGLNNKKQSKQLSSHRKEIIVDFIRKNGQASIKDIATVISDCSEKTIQRELAGLVKAGILKRSGERRWAKYSLA